MDIAVIIAVLMVAVAFAVNFWMNKKRRAQKEVEDMSGIHQMLIVGGAGTGPAKYTGTVTAGNLTDGSTFSDYGYVSGSYGSASPTTLVDGKTLVEIYTDYAPPGSFSTNVITISGFSSDPTSAYLTSVKVGGTTYPIVASYGYSGGIASWTFNSSGPIFPQATGAYSVELF